MSNSDQTPALLFACLSYICANIMCVSSSESPLQFYVNNANSPNVTAYGPGLVYGVANKPATFTIYTEDEAEGEQHCSTVSSVYLT